MPAHRPADERFWEKVNIIPESCWEWTANKHERGYGRFWPEHSVQVQAHAYAYQFFNGPIPEDTEIDHLCRNHSCCNPKHLEPVTHRVNVLRGEGPQAYNARKVKCAHGHEFSVNNVRLEGPHRTQRRCLTCEKLRTERRRVKRQQQREAQNSCA